MPPPLVSGQKLRNLKLETFEESNQAALQTAVNDWLVARGEEELVWIYLEAPSASQYDCFILYTEE